MRTLNLLVLMLLATCLESYGGRVLLIGVDGCRYDALLSAATPTMDSLAATGIIATGHIGDITYSGPGWSTIFTGVWRDKHGVTDNSFSDSNFDEYPHVIARVKEQDPSAYCGSISHWGPIETAIVTGSNADTSIVVATDAQVAASASNLLMTQDVSLLCLQFDDVDHAGHAYGFSPSVPNYIAAIASVDGHIRTVLAALRSRPNFAAEDWLVMVTTDHGGAGYAHGANEYIIRLIWIVLSGGGAVQHDLVPHPSSADIVPTALAHMGIPVPESLGLDGHKIVLEVPTDTLVALGENFLVNGDAERDRGFWGYSPDGAVSGWDSIPSWTSIRYGSGSGLPDAEDPGSTERGASFFAAGTSAAQALYQRFDVAEHIAQIDAGQAAYVLSGYLGGFRNHDDRAELQAYFLGTNGDTLGSATIGPVYAAERCDETGMIAKAEGGVLPVGTRVVSVKLLGTQARSTNDAFADDLSFVIEDLDETDCNNNSVPDRFEILDGSAEDCNGNARPDACDIVVGYSLDLNGNGMPDDCEYWYTAAPESLTIVGTSTADSVYLRWRAVPTAQEYYIFDGTNPDNAPVVIGTTMDTRYGMSTAVAASKTLWVSARTSTPCDSALALNCGQTYSGTTAGRGDVAGNDAPDQVFSITIPDSAIVTWSLCSGTTFDTYMRLYRGCELTCDRQLAGNDDYCGLQSQLVRLLAPGSYQLVVEGFAELSGPYSVTMSCADWSDSPCGTAELIACGGQASGTTVGRTNHVGNAAGDYFFRAAGTGGSVTFSLCSGTTYDSWLRVYDGCPLLDGVQVASNDDFCNLQSQVTLTTTTEEYWIVVEGFQSNEGPFTLAMICGAPPYVRIDCPEALAKPDKSGQVE